MVRKLGIVGFPSLYGGAGVELDNQMTLWYDMGIELHLIPTYDPSNEPLLNRTLYRAKVHSPCDYSKLKNMQAGFIHIILSKQTVPFL